MFSLGSRLCDPMVEGDDMECARGGMVIFRWGRRLGRVTVKRTTLRKPERANTTSEKTVPAKIPDVL